MKLPIELRTAVLKDVDAERDRQDDKFGIQRHDDGTWLKILIEEVGEVAQAMQKDEHWGKDSDAGQRYDEAIQVAAVALAYAENLIAKGERFE